MYNSFNPLCHIPNLHGFGEGIGGDLKMRHSFAVLLLLLRLIPLEEMGDAFVKGSLDGDQALVLFDLQWRRGTEFSGIDGKKTRI